MKFIHTLAALGIVCLLAACTSGSDHKATAKHEAPPAKIEKAPIPSQGSNDVVATAAGEVVLDGKTGCGHCTYHIGESCAVGLQTADGKVYILDGLGEDSDLFKTRFDRKSITVKGRVSERDGQAHVLVASYEAK